MNTYGFLWFHLTFYIISCKKILKKNFISLLYFGWHLSIKFSKWCTVYSNKCNLLQNQSYVQLIGMQKNCAKDICVSVTKNKIKSIVVSKADYSCIWFLNSGIITTELSILRIIPTKFQLNPFSSFEGVVSSRFEFNWRSRLGAVMQNLCNHGTIRYPKEHTHKIWAQSIQWFMRNCDQLIWVQSAQLFRSSCTKTK